MDDGGCLKAYIPLIVGKFLSFWVYHWHAAIMSSLNQYATICIRSNHHSWIYHELEKQGNPFMQKKNENSKLKIEIKNLILQIIRDHLWWKMYLSGDYWNSNQCGCINMWMGAPRYGISIDTKR